MPTKRFSQIMHHLRAVVQVVLLYLLVVVYQSTRARDPLVQLLQHDLLRGDIVAAFRDID